MCTCTRGKKTLPPVIMWGFSLKTWLKYNHCVVLTNFCDQTNNLSWQWEKLQITFLFYQNVYLIQNPDKEKLSAPYIITISSEHPYIFRSGCMSVCCLCTMKICLSAALLIFVCLFRACSIVIRFYPLEPWQVGKKGTVMSFL